LKRGFLDEFEKNEFETEKVIHSGDADAESPNESTEVREPTEK